MRLLLLLVALLCAPASAGEVFLTKEEALALAFPDCEVTRSSVALTKEQKARVTKLGGTGCVRSLVYPYVATKEGEVVGTAWFDVHKVRTLRETLMIVVDPEGKIARVEVLAFGEPAEYMPRAKWYAGLVGRGLDDSLSLKKKKGVPKVTGATLTVRATLEAARRTLALHQVWNESLDPEPDEDEGGDEEQDAKKREDKKGAGKRPAQASLGEESTGTSTR